VVMCMESPRIVSTEVRICEDTVTPCLFLKIRVEGIETGGSVYIPVGGMLYSDDGKLLSQVIIDDAFFGPAGSIAAPSIIVNYLEAYSSIVGLTHTLDLRCRAFLDTKSVSYIEERRRSNKYHRVMLKLRLRFLALHSTVYHYDYIYGARGQYFSSLPSGAIVLKSGKPLLYVEPQVYEELETNIVIDGPQWIRDFLSVLGLGNYVLLEIPLPRAPSISDKALQYFTNTIELLRRTKEILHETLNAGSSLTALRNALNQFCEALKSLDLAVSRDGGCEIDYERLVELFQGIKELADVVVTIYTKVKRITTVGPEPTQPHIAPRPALTLHQVESLIGLASYIIKLVMDTYIDRLSHSQT